MYEITYTNKFKADWKRCERRGLPMERIMEAINTLAMDGVLPPKYKTHKLSGKFAGCMECHIMPDWLMVWKQDEKKLTLLLTDTGSHSDLFG